MDNKVWSLLDMVKWGSDYFKSKKIDSPRLTIELLLCKLLDIERIQIYTQFDKPLTPAELKELKAMIKRRVSNEPLQYILGVTNFLGYNLEVNRNVLIPRPETEILVDTVLKCYKDYEYPYKILDIGTGSGCISIVLASKFRNSSILAIDNSEKSLEVAEKNFRNNNLNNIETKKIDILKELPSNEKYDLIVSNPPYICINDYNKLPPEIKLYEPQFALTDLGNGLIFYERYSEIFKTLLQKDGNFFVEIGYGQETEIKKIFKDKGYDTIIIKDLNNVPRIISKSNN